MSDVLADLAYDRASWNLRRAAVRKLREREAELQAVVDRLAGRIRERRRVLAALDEQIAAKRELLTDLDDVLRLVSDVIPPDPDGPARLREARRELFPNDPSLTTPRGVTHHRKARP